MLFFVCAISLLLVFKVSAVPAAEQPYDFKIRMASVKLDQCYKKLDEDGCEEFVIKTAKDIIKGLPECFEAYYVLGGAYCKELKKAYLLLGELAPFSVHRMTRFKVETYSPGSFSNLLLLCPTDH